MANPAVKKKILIVDDEVELVTLLKDRLEREGYEVLTAYDGKTGLERARKDCPHLILLDVAMPKMNGFEVCNELKRREETKGIIVVMLTAKAQDAERYRGLKSGADDYIVKPFDMKVVLGRVRYLLEKEPRPKILIADDDRDLVRILADRLGFEGFETVAAYEGLRVIEIARHQCPDLILLDLQMPAGTGQSVLQNLRSHAETQKIPVIVLTGFDADRVEGEVMQTGAQDFIHKPYEVDDLLKKIRHLLT